MTKEPIMIDDVDVSKCDFLAKEDDYCSYSGEYRAYKGQCGCSDEEFCKDHPNCFYKKALKQLKRKEQALKEIKEIAESVLIECNHCDQYSCSGCPDENKDELAEQILQKCEVLDAK